jgi:hypothetical protein
LRQNVEFTKLSDRRYFIDTITFLASIEEGDYLWFLPYNTLRFLYRFGNTHLNIAELFQLHQSNYIVVHNLFEDYTDMVTRVIKTQQIKQELFQRTIPNYQPPSLRQRLFEQLGFDVSNISIRGIQMIQRWFAIYTQMDDRTWGDNDEFDSAKHDILYTFDLMVSAIHSSSTIKEELVAKVYHPERVDQWVNYV